MTAKEAIAQAERMRPGSMAGGDALEWLYALEARIMTEVAGRMPPPRLEMDDELIAIGTYARIYPLWLCAQSDFANAKAARYNNGAEMFNEVYEAFTAWWTRTHKPCQRNYIKGVR